MRQDDALRRAGRSGGVRDRGDRLQAGRPGPGRPARTSVTQAGRLHRQVRVDHHGTHVRERRGLARDVGARGVRDQDARARVTDEPGDLLGGRARRDRHRDGAEPPQRVEGRDGRRLVARDHADRLSRADPVADEGARELVARRRELPEGDRAPAEREPARRRRAAPPAAAGRRARSGEAGRRPRWMREP